MTTKLATAKNSYGHAIRLQKRAGKFDVITNSAGLSWRYLCKAVSEQEARAVYELQTLGA